MKKSFAKRSLAMLVVLALLFAMLPAARLTVSAAVPTTAWSANATTEAWEGEGTEASPYLITSEAHLAKFGTEVSTSEGKYYKLTKDLDMSAHLWSVGQFKGNLDGDGHTITGLIVSKTSGNNWGFVQQLVGGTIKNLKLEIDMSVTHAFSYAQYGGIAGNCTGTIENCSVAGSITVTSSGTPAAEVNVGGIAGKSSGTIKNCVSSASITVTNTSTNQATYVGGIVGQTVTNALSIKNCVNKGNVTANTSFAIYIGGILGWANVATDVANCANLGNVTATLTAGAAHYSGVVGRCERSKGTVNVYNCYNAGVVSATGYTSASHNNDIYSNNPTNVQNADAATMYTNYVWDGDQYKGAYSGSAIGDSAALLAKLNEYVTANNANNDLVSWTMISGYPIPDTGLIPPVAEGVLDGTATITGTAKLNEKLTASVVGANSQNLTYQWQRLATGDGAVPENIAGATSAEYTAALADIGYRLLCVVSSTDKTGTLSAQTAIVEKLDGPAAPAGLATVKASSATTADGKITGTDNTMEYSADPSFATATACTGNEITGLLPGRYYVRVRATETTAAGSAVTVVVGDATVTFEGKWTDEGNYTSGALQGTGTQADPYLITNEKDLAKLAVSFNTENATKDKYFKVTATELDLSAHEWVTIAEFAGVFDGNGVKIKGLQIGTKTMPYAGLPVRDVRSGGMFGVVTSTGIIKNLEADVAVYVEYDEQCVFAVGGIVGLLNGSIDNIVTTGEVWARLVNDGAGTYDMYIGGIAGRVRAVEGVNITISNCINRADVTGIHAVTNSTRNIMVGGIAGRIQNDAATKTSLMSLLNCANYGTITATGETTTQRVAGLVGQIDAADTNNKAQINNCFNAGFVAWDRGKSEAGNLVGKATNGAFVNVFWTEDSGAPEGGVDYQFAKKLAAAAGTNGELLNLLNVGAATLNENLGSGKEIAYKWAADSNGYPELTNVINNEKTVKVTVNSARMGSVSVEIQAPGSTTWAPADVPVMVAPGTKVKLTVNPVTGCSLGKLTVTGGVTGEYTTLTNNVFEFEVTTGSVQLHVEFKVGELVDCDPVYVDPDATVNGTGTESSPFNSLTAAQEHVRALIAQHPTANVTVYLMGGTFRLEEPLVFEAQDASLGTVTWKNYGEEEAIISSAVLVDKTFTKVEGKDYYKLQLDKVGGAYPHFRDLLINGKRATLARSASYLFKKTYTEEGGLFVDPSLVEGITAENIGKLELVSVVEWKSQLYHIDTIGATAGGVTEIEVVDSEWDFYMSVNRNAFDLVGREYWMQNHLVYLDEPGEFFYDETSGTVYYMPYTNENMSTATVEYATLDKMIQLMDTANITFDGLTITGTTANWVTDNGFAGSQGNCYIAYENDPGTNPPLGAIYGDIAENITIKNCVFTELGATCILINSGAKNISVIGNSFTESAMGAIVIGKHQRQYNEGGYPGGSEKITISNNYISNIGKEYISAPAISVARTIDLTITHNTIIHVPYSGIAIGWGFNVRAEDDFPNLQNAEVAYNYIDGYVSANNDGGGIYACGANAMPDYTEMMNSIHDNVVKANAYGGMTTAVYLDGSSSNFHVYNNVLIDVEALGGPIYFQDGVASQNTHNILAENNFTTKNPISTSAKADRNVVLKNNTVFADMNELSAAAKAIMAAAGLEEAYKNIVSPMEIEVVMADPTVHYVLKETNNFRISANIQITNNSDLEKTFTVTLNGTTPSVVETSFENNTITLAAGATGTLTVDFVVTDPDEIYDSSVCINDLIVKDSTGKVETYRRAFSVATLAGKHIAYGTPVVDGKLDDAYKGSVKVNFGEIFHPTADSVTDMDGHCYLLWDEQYLYAYVVVNDNTVMSLGADYIKANPARMWRGDTVETYIVTDWKGMVADTKFALDAFGLCRYGDTSVALDKHAVLPFATAFTYNGQVIEGYKITNPATCEMASTAQQPVNGYVIEMTLPLTEVSTITNGVPTVGDEIAFYIQNNDLKDAVNFPTSGNPETVCRKTAKKDFVLHKHVTTKVDGKDATCTEAGVAEYYHCDECGKTFADANATQVLETMDIAPKGHTATKVNMTAATCTGEGNVEYYHCSVCNKNFSDEECTKELTSAVITATGHKLTKVEGKAATETATGIKEHYACSECGKLFLDEQGKTETTDVVILMLDPTPDTGDGTPVTWFIALAVLSAACAAVLVTGKKFKF